MNEIPSRREKRRRRPSGNWNMTLGRTFLGEHEFVAFGVEAEGEMNETVFFLGFADQAATVFLNEFDSDEDVVALEAEAGPCAFSFTTAMNSNRGATEGDLAPDFHFEGEFCAKGLLVEFNGTEVVGCPDGIFHFLNLHGR